MEDIKTYYKNYRKNYYENNKEDINNIIKSRFSVQGKKKDALNYYNTKKLLLQEQKALF